MSYIEIAVGQSELEMAPSRKAIWWDLRLASLLTHCYYFALGWVPSAAISVSVYVCLSVRSSI